MDSIRHVLVGTEMSPSDLPALLYARLFADRFGASLSVVYSEPIAYPVDVIGGAPASFIAADPEQQKVLRAEVAGHVLPLLGERQHDILLLTGPPATTILMAASQRSADFIVVGKHHRHGWRRALLGSTSDAVLHGAECPVLTVTADERHNLTAPEVKTVLCPVNFTEAARESLRVATMVAAAFDAKLIAVHVVEGDAPNAATSDEARVREWIGPALQQPVSYRQLIVRGGPAERVLDCAEDLAADLLVVGAQHRLFRDETVIGTTTERLIRFAPCPVLVVPRALSRARVPGAPTRE
jgi:nucleotide-binding universal stress UspA family protein